MFHIAAVGFSASACGSRLCSIYHTICTKMGSALILIEARLLHSHHVRSQFFVATKKFQTITHACHSCLELLFGVGEFHLPTHFFLPLTFRSCKKKKKKTCSLLFNERCSSSPCQQQCVTVTAWCHLASPSGDTRLSARICSPVLLPWHRRTGKWTWGPRNEPSGRLWATRRLRLIRVPQLVVFWCVGHSVFAPVDESEHHVRNYSSLAPSSRPLKGQRLASARFDIRRDCLCCVSLWHLGGGVKGAGGGYSDAGRRS